MRPEDLQLNLRPRSSWEAMELGAALLRRHASAVWRPWLLVVLAAALLCNGLAWWVGWPWLGAVLLWWTKPALEQVPLYVLSRAVFGQVPTTAASLRALPAHGARWLPAYLGWRRLGPARSLLMPVDLLEGNTGVFRGKRRRILAGPAYPQACLLTLISATFELVLVLGTIAGIFMFVPAERLPDSLHAFWDATSAGAWWLPVLTSTAALVALLVIGPFYVAAGLGLYLNRRSESEAWDLELAFRQLRQRLLQPLLGLLLGLGMAMGACLPGPALAQQAEPGQTSDSSKQRKTTSLSRVFGQEHVDDERFRRAALKAYQDPLLGKERTVVTWRPKESEDERGKQDLSALFAGVVAGVALISEWGLWILLGLLLVVIVVTARIWLPWLQGTGARRRRAVETPPQSDALILPETLPDNIPRAARRLWREGRPRAALALLYRASVEAMVTRTGQALPAGATEAQCLRASRHLDGSAQSAFAALVKVWQYAAYAGRLPEAEEFEALLARAVAEWGWSE